jgi:hypothetical protein
VHEGSRLAAGEGGKEESDHMAEVTFPISKEVWHVLVEHPRLPEKLRRILEDRACTSELNDAYEAQWTKAEATRLRDFARSHALRGLLKDIQQRLDGLESRKRARPQRGKP